ncbi:phosphate-starvation-inducible PsiE family protein [Candidatus Pelagibacter bacterium]|jgi:protein PsiE|nr:phosphate-starvation-inducible PsiE family protein [Candidatus Pelagibacter bacterium]|tara:strand:+ start:81 stop:467 length:387 start_codon:yes stop_codon:yes gene_type:complete
MNKTIRNIQLTAVLVVLISTVIAFFLEIKEMYVNQNITLADLLLMFIYIEVIGLVKSYWETRAVRITYPLVIAITALARFIILQDKESDPANLIYISVAILIVALATVIIRFRNSKYLKIDKSKSSEL